jgi:hypothetical protein
MLLIFTTSMLSANSGSTTYLRKCAGCLIIMENNTVLGKSKVINKMKADEIEQALYNYAAGNCRVEVPVCEPKNPMIQHRKKAFIQNSTKEQIHALAVYISQQK